MHHVHKVSNKLTFFISLILIIVLAHLSFLMSVHQSSFFPLNIHHLIFPSRFNTQLFPKMQYLALVLEYNSGVQILSTCTWKVSTCTHTEH